MHRGPQRRWMVFPVGVSHDPVEKFFTALELVWQKLSAAYDVTAELPNLKLLFEGSRFEDPALIAQTVLANMLVEITDQVHRFSPWYKLPPRSFGLVNRHPSLKHIPAWNLAPEAIERWCPLIELISSEIQYKTGLVKALVMIDRFEDSLKARHPKVIARCQCDPPQRIAVQPLLLQKGSITCETCQMPFAQLEHQT